jgi:hypothetical protein
MKATTFFFGSCDNFALPLSPPRRDEFKKFTPRRIN